MYSSITDGYLNHLRNEKKASPHTLRKSSGLISLWMTSVRNPLNVSRDEARTFLASQSHLKASSLRTNWAYIRSFNEYLKREHGASIDTDGISVRDPIKRLPRAVSVTFIKRIINNPDASTALGKRDKAALELLWCSGIRASELTSLHLSDANREAKCLRVMGKGGKERFVPLTKKALKALDDWLAVRHTYVRPVSGDCVFLTRHGRPMSYKSLRGLVRKAGNITPHVFRHSLASALVPNMDMRSLQELLGHASLRSTEVYTHVNPAQMMTSYHKAMKELDG